MLSSGTMSEIMLDTYNRVISSLSKSGADTEHAKVDTAALIVVMTRYTYAHKSSMSKTVDKACSSFLSICSNPYNQGLIVKRISFYMQFIIGKQPYGEWIFDEDGFGREYDIIRAQAAYGDLLIAPDFYDDYGSCTYQIMDRFTFRFVRFLQDEIMGTFNLMLMKYKNDQHNSKADLRNTIIGLLSFVAVLLLIVYFVVQNESTSTPSSISAGNPFSNSQYDEILNGMKKPSVTATPKPALIYNGRRFIVPDYTPVCPFEVNAGSDGDYYIYLKYQKAPTYSQEGRARLASATAPYESDMAFIVKAGQTVELDVPIGVYKLYYATGKTFYNTTILFGDNTQYYESDDLLTFNASGNYYNGHTITLYEVVNGNLDTDEISEKSFPTR